MTQIPVYLFTGFLDAGKTRFIRETLEDPRYNDGTPTLLLICEEGEEEYDTSKMPHPVAIQTVEEPEELKPKLLERMVKSSRAQRVFVEYNGMWNSGDLFDALPEGWIVVQEFCFMDSTTIMTYNANMRNLVADKLQTAEMVIFNRLQPSADIMPYHKLVRGLSRRADIVYEDINGQVTTDTIEDPLPFDLNAPLVAIEDRDYAIWYRDLTEELQNYEGKTVQLKGRIILDERSDGSFFVFGRQMMTCCVDDIQFAGVVCLYPDAFSLKNGQWATVTAKIHIGSHEAYGRQGPILTVIDVENALPPEEEVASFY
ncbi:MAG: GTPase [Clostridia bacterium]|nr:GTPase [Clostridia bacterium]